VADLDEDEYYALLDVVEERRREESWGNTQELLAATVEALWTVCARLDAGIAVVQVARTERPNQPPPYPRPSWMADAPQAKPVELVFRSPADAFRVLKGGRDD
jgi:hypothetical protein